MEVFKRMAGGIIRIIRVISFRVKILLADRTLFLVMVIFPAVFSLIAGYTVRKEATGIPGVALVDEDQTLISAGFIERLTAHPGIRAEALSREEAYGKLEAYKVEAVFVITRGFGEKIEAGEAKELLEYTMLPSSYSEGYFLEVFAGQVMTLLSREMSLDKCAAAYKGAGLEVGADFYKEVGEYFDSHWEEGPPMRTLYTEMQGDREVGSSSSALPVSETIAVGMILVFTMFYVLASSGWLLDEKEQDTLKRLRSAPGALAFSFWGGVFALIICGGLQMAGSILVLRITSGKAIITGMGKYALLALYLLTSVSMSMLFSAAFKTRGQLQAFTPVFALAAGFIGGCFWGIPELPGGLRNLSLLTPQGWVLEGFRRLLPTAANTAPGHIFVPFLILAVLPLILLASSYTIAIKSSYY
jgi:ABC-2 type transport system permease protein